jgi:hypothetical protein
MQTLHVTPEERKAYLASLPVDDEPLTEHERHALEQYRRTPHDTVSSEELLRQLTDEPAPRSV